MSTRNPKPCTLTQSQYLLCAGGVFFFTLIYGFLQELVIVKIFDRQLSLFLALCQFWCYTVCSGVATALMSPSRSGLPGGSQGKVARWRGLARSALLFVRSTPWRKFLGIAVLRTFDLGLTNSSMKVRDGPQGERPRTLQPTSPLPSVVRELPREDPDEGESPEERGEELRRRVPPNSTHTSRHSLC